VTVWVSLTGETIPWEKYGTSLSLWFAWHFHVPSGAYSLTAVAIWLEVES
jgi:hypothetical protein